MELCFIYGTLKKGQCRASVMESANYLGTALTTRDFNIFHMGGYPALVKYDLVSLNDKKDLFQKGVWGELYECDTDLVKQLDRIEGYPTLYDRSFVELEQLCLVNLPTTVETSQRIFNKSCVSYFYVDPYNRIDLQSQHIESGIWLDELSN